MAVTEQMRVVGWRPAFGRAVLLSFAATLLCTTQQAQQAGQSQTGRAWSSTDTTKPPVCPGAKPAIRNTTVQLAEQQQLAGRANPSAILAYEPMENFGIGRYRLAAYADCTGEEGCYWADVDAQYRRAEKALADALLHAKPGEKLAIVMDIDETALSGYCEMKREDYGFIGSMFNSWVVTPEASLPIPGGVRLFRRARAAGMDVFFITGRPGQPDPGSRQPAPDETQATSANLELAGYDGWKDLRLRNGPENSMETVTYKSSERAKIIAAGYRIIMSVGDQWSDLLGEPQAEVSVKLPNPFYFIP